ncbi:MAG: hypothetical protein KAV87_34460 [Desulfobacteraceae bacterium]|nr:hypothetical protein [Desulfobacteraceae bacterium]
MSKQWGHGFHKGKESGEHSGIIQGEFQANCSMAEQMNVLIHAMEGVLGEGHYQKWVILGMMKELISEHVGTLPESWQD